MYNLEIFPNKKCFNDIPERQNLQIQAYGRRITKDQTFYEYLIEFLLVFIGEKNGEKGFKKIKDYNQIVEYSYNTNTALKRFIFFENSKKDNKFKIDEQAYEKLNEILSNKIVSDDFSNKYILSVLRELYNGFIAFSGERGWFAKVLLPICEETIFPEAMGKKNIRGSESLELYNSDDTVNTKVETEFEFNEHNFMARGGEVYFLHLLQGFDEIKKTQGANEERIIKEKLESSIFQMLNSLDSFKVISQWIQNSWLEFLKDNISEDEKNNIDSYIKAQSKCMWVTEKFRKRSKYAVYEFYNVISTDLNNFDKYELLSLTIIFQLLRAMTECSADIATDGDVIHPAWILDVDTNGNNKVLRRICVENYNLIEEYMTSCIAKMLDNYSEIKKDSIRSKKSEIQLLKEGYEDSYKLLRKLGKDIGLIIPIKGSNMRFSINDDIIKFFVFSLIKPGKKITFDTFLSDIYEHFGVVIGPREYSLSLVNSGKSGDVSVFEDNAEEFLILLRKNGFLKELSDATSIVVNPYGVMGDI